MSPDHDDRRQRIWGVVKRIPPGRVATYGQVARLAGLPGYARFVGTVLRDLPKDTRLPWHRVINAQGRISFPPGSDGHTRQSERLRREGVLALTGRRDLARYGWTGD